MPSRRPAATRSDRPTEADHWHRTGTDPGRPYRFTDAATLIGDFFTEVERVLTERRVPINVQRETDNTEREQP